MNATLKNKIEKLTKAHLALYVARGHYNPEISATYAVQDIINQYRTQSNCLEQLLDTEIEDAEKALAAGV
jgi:polyhydroxyalkanoate synthesis regulator phasin